MSAADDYVFRWTPQHETEAIRRQTIDRELVADYIEHARERHEQDRRSARRAVRAVFAAVFVSLVGVAMIFGLILGWFSQATK